MHFTPLIDRWGIIRLAEALGLPAKNVRSWSANDSIPGGWFERVAATGIATLDELAIAGTAREKQAEQGRLEKKHRAQQASV